MNENERPLLNVDLLRSFAAIAETGGLTTAAARLGRTQSAVSVQLRKLEEDLGASLFERRRAGMRLTAAGRALLPKARALVDEVRAVGALFAEPLRGRIRIGVPDDFDDGALEAVLAGFSRRHPGVDVVARSGCAAGYPDAIRSGALDLAVCSGPADEEAAGETLEVQRTIWACAKGARVDPDAPIPLAVLDRECWWASLPVAALESAGRAYEIAFRSGDFASQRAAIRSGFAIGAIPANSMDEGMAIPPRSIGLPPLPSALRRIVVADGAPSDVAEAMSASIRAARLGV